MSRLLLLIAIAASSAALLCSAAAADVFVLSNEGRIEGELLNPDESPRKVYRIRTPFGGEVSFDREEVVEVIRQSDREAEYEHIRPTYPDTVEGQWALAEWCRERYMSDQRETHLQRVIELDPDHLEARRALGFRQIDGRWVTQEQLNTERGLVRYKGRWMLPHEVDIAEKRRKVDLAEKEWMRRLKQWRDWLDSARADEAVNAIRSIDDPHAVKGLQMRLQNEANENVRRLYLNALANIGDPRARAILVEAALKSNDEETRLTALDHLVEEHDPGVVSQFVGALKHADNKIVNRAGVALGRLNDPAAIPPLVDALVTTHKFEQTSGSPGGISAGFSSGGGTSSLGTGSPGGLSFGQQKVVVNVPMQNPAVLDALIRLTRVNFDYDQKRWNHWLATQRRPESVDVRRD